MRTRGRQHRLHAKARGWRVDQLAAGHQSRRLCQPGGKPERPDLAARMIAGARAAVETVERWRLQEQSLHHLLCNPYCVVTWSGTPPGCISRCPAKSWTMLAWRT